MHVNALCTVTIWLAKADNPVIPLCIGRGQRVLPSLWLAVSVGMARACHSCYLLQRGMSFALRPRPRILYADGLFPEHHCLPRLSHLWQWMKLIQEEGPEHSKRRGSRVADRVLW